MALCGGVDDKNGMDKVLHNIKMLCICICIIFGVALYHMDFHAISDAIEVLLAKL